MDPRLWLIIGLFAVWGLIYLVIGLVKKVTHHVLSGVAVILLAGSMPLFYESHWTGWVVVAIATLLAVAALRMRFTKLFGKR